MNLIFIIFISSLSKSYCLSEKKIDNPSSIILNNMNDLDNQLNLITTKNSKHFQKKNLDIKKLIDTHTEPLGIRFSLQNNLQNFTYLHQNKFRFTEINKIHDSFFRSQPFVWSNITTSGNIPSPRKSYTAVLADSFIVIFGGCLNDYNFHNELFFYDILAQTWINIKQSGKVPSPRCGHTARIFGSIMWIFGGYSAEGFLDDLYSFDFETVTYKKFYF